MMGHPSNVISCQLHVLFMYSSCALAPPPPLPLWEGTVNWVWFHWGRGGGGLLRTRGQISGGGYV